VRFGTSVVSLRSLRPGSPLPHRGGFAYDAASGAVVPLRVPAEAPGSPPTLAAVCTALHGSASEGGPFEAILAFSYGGAAYAVEVFDAVAVCADHDAHQRALLTGQGAGAAGTGLAGWRVALAGLSSAKSAHLNGRTGTVLTHAAGSPARVSASAVSVTSFNAATGRYSVLLDSLSADGAGASGASSGAASGRGDEQRGPFTLKPSNLVPLAPLEPPAPPPASVSHSSGDPKPPRYGRERSQVSGAEHLEHFVLDPSEPRLAFIGGGVGGAPCDNPSVAEVQVLWWCRRLVALSVERSASGKRAAERRSMDATTDATMDATTDTSAEQRAMFRAARWARLAGRGGAWAADGTFLLDGIVDGVPKGSAEGAAEGTTKGTTKDTVGAQGGGGSDEAAAAEEEALPPCAGGAAGLRDPGRLLASPLKWWLLPTGPRVGPGAYLLKHGHRPFDVDYRCVIGLPVPVRVICRAAPRFGPCDHSPSLQFTSALRTITSHCPPPPSPSLGRTCLRWPLSAAAPPR